jgi:hypothetical protein
MVYNRHQLVFGKILMLTFNQILQLRLLLLFVKKVSVIFKLKVVQFHLLIKLLDLRSLKQSIS